MKYNRKPLSFSRLSRIFLSPERDPVCPIMYEKPTSGSDGEFLIPVLWWSTM